MLPSTAQMWTWASVSPGISVAPRQSSVVTGPGQRTDLPVREHVLDAVVLDDDRGARHRVGAGAVDQQRVGEDGQAHRGVTFASYIQTFSSARGVHSTWLRHAVEVVLLPQEDPGRLVADQPLQLGVGLGARLRVRSASGPARSSRRSSCCCRTTSRSGRPGRAAGSCPGRRAPGPSRGRTCRRCCGS